MPLRPRSRGRRRVSRMRSIASLTSSSTVICSRRTADGLNQSTTTLRYLVCSSPSMLSSVLTSKGMSFWIAE